MILEKIGKPAMYELLAEESIELAFAALKMARILRGENPTPRTERDVSKDLVEEVTDVKMCLDELDIYPDKLTGERKSARFKERWLAAHGEEAV